MIKAVFFDLDGTLLDSNKKIPASAKEAILKCRKNGVSIFFATARSPRLDQTLDWKEDDFALFDGGIYSNGACVQYGGKLDFCYIDPRAVKICLSEIEHYEDVHLSLHMPEEGYAFTFPVDAAMNKSWGFVQAKIYPISEDILDRITKCLLFYDHLTDSTRALPHDLCEKLRIMCGDLANVYITDAGRTIQLSGKDAGKLRSIERIREQLRLNVDEISVFGDDINDFEMISHYPNSVAMGNARPQIKEAAGFITHSNDEGGIAHALKDILHIG